MKAPITRRNLLHMGFAGGTLAALGAVAGCSKSDAPNSSGTNPATWSMWSSSPEEEKVWTDFRAYVDKTMNVASVSNLTPSKGYQTKLDLQFASKTTSMVTAVNGWLVPTYAARGALLPLDDFIKNDADFDYDDFYPDIKSICSFDEKTYAVGFDVAPMVLYINKTLFEKHGVPLPSSTVPMTWEEFRASALEFSKTPDEYGFTCSPNIDDLGSWMYSAGGDVMNKEQTANTLGSEESMAALRFVHDLFVKDKVTPPISNLVTMSSLANFMDGNVAYMQNGPWQVLNVRNADFEWDIIPFPAGPAGSLPRVSGSGFAIPKTTKNPDQAWELLKTLTSTGALEIYATAGRNNPARKSVGTAFVPPPENLSIVQDILAGELAGGTPYPVTTNWNEIRTLLGQDLPPSFLGQVSIDEAVKNVTPRLDGFIKAHQDNMKKFTS